MKDRSEILTESQIMSEKIKLKKRLAKCLEWESNGSKIKINEKKTAYFLQALARVRVEPSAIVFAVMSEPPDEPSLHRP